MMNIATLTLNPTIDLSYEIDRLAPTRKLRATVQRSDPGGGGINVARVFVRMGGNARCIYLSGGPTGIALDALLDLHQLVRDHIQIQGETRTSCTVYEGASGHEYRVVPIGPEVSEAEWQACLNRIGMMQCDFLVMSGSLPRGVPEDFYARAVRQARRRGIAVALDTSGAALAAGLADGGLDLIKPNLEEFEQLVGRKLNDDGAIADAASKLVASGKVRLVAVTMGERGGILVSAAGSLKLEAPDVEVASSVGAGDSFLAAMVHGLLSGDSDEAAFRRGIAAGAAALISPGTGLASRGDIQRLYDGLGATC